MKQALQTRFQHVGSVHISGNRFDESGCPGCPIGALGAQLVPWVPNWCPGCPAQVVEAKRKEHQATPERPNGKTAQKRRMKKNLYFLSINMDLEDESGTIPEFSRGENSHPETSASRFYSWVCREVTITA